VRFIDEHKDHRVDGGLRWGVEPICEVLTEHHLPIAPATYHAAKTRPPAARAVRDAELAPLIARVHQDNYGVSGARKMHAAVRRDRVEIGRDQTARLMREPGLSGVRRGTVTRTTIRDDAAARPADLANRGFRAPRPDRLWVADLTYLRTWVGFAYLALVIDVVRPPQDRRLGRRRSPAHRVAAGGARARRVDPLAVPARRPHCAHRRRQSISRCSLHRRPVRGRGGRLGRQRRGLPVDRLIARAERREVTRREP
jgi:hypothetical protein